MATAKDMPQFWKLQELNHNPVLSNMVQVQFLILQPCDDFHKSEPCSFLAARASAKGLEMCLCLISRSHIKRNKAQTPTDQENKCKARRIFKLEINRV